MNDKEIRDAAWASMEANWGSTHLHEHQLCIDHIIKTTIELTRKTVEDVRRR